VHDRRLVNTASSIALIIASIGVGRSPTTSTGCRTRILRILDLVGRNDVRVDINHFADHYGSLLTRLVQMDSLSAHAACGSTNSSGMVIRLSVRRCLKRSSQALRWSPYWPPCRRAAGLSQQYSSKSRYSYRSRPQPSPKRDRRAIRLSGRVGLKEIAPPGVFLQNAVLDYDRAVHWVDASLLVPGAPAPWRSE